jgi:glyoxylase-like metal-dependent hydrolase (beta-lactamase superfamily II)
VRASRQANLIVRVFLVLTAIAGVCAGAANEVLSRSVTVSTGAINGVCIERSGHRLVIYGDPLQRWKTADMVLLSHSRRDVVWAARAMVEGGAKSIVPAREQEQFSKVEDFWTSFWEKRFHDYDQQSTRIITTSLRVDQTVQEGTPLPWQGLEVQVLDTPGYTRGSVSYFVEIDGRKYGFVGDLIYGDGHLLDLYSLQDAVPQAKIGGYHGYAGRIGDLIASLRKVAAQKADILVPARGPVLREPAAAVSRLIERLQAVYENYLSISAGHWYFRDQYDTLAARALGRADRVPWMPNARTVEKQPPDWIVPIQNSRLLLSRDREGFLIDCGSGAIIGEIRKLKDQGRLVSLDGLFITHYHDDHTDKVNELLEEYHCPVYVTPILEDVLKRPGAYRLPCETMNAIERLDVVADGQRKVWKEFVLTFYDFPGQTIYHDAMLAQRDTGERVFFIGDSFTPSGIDDYCLQNRNLLHDGTGFSYCLDLVSSRIPQETLLINEHVVEPFRFDADQVRHMEKVLARRKESLRELFPWEGPDFGIDEQWARIYPYGQEVQPEHWAELAVELLNHSNAPTTFRVTLNAPAGFEIDPSRASVAAGPGREGEAHFRIRALSRPSSPVQVVTADIQVGPWELRQWCEGLLKVLP